MMHLRHSYPAIVALILNFGGLAFILLMIHFRFPIPSEAVLPINVDLNLGNDQALPGTNKDGRERPRHITHVRTAQVERSISVVLANNYSDGPLFASVVGYDVQHVPKILQTSEQWLWPADNAGVAPNLSIAFPLSARGQTTTLNLPGLLQSGRIYISAGELTFAAPDWTNPSVASAGRIWAYIELTKGVVDTYVDISYVDFVCLPLALEMTTSQNKTTVIPGMNTRAVQNLCNRLQDVAKQEARPWDQLCEYSADGGLIRVISPGKYTAMYPAAFETYFTPYVEAVYQRFSRANNLSLTIDGQRSGFHSIKCQASQNQSQLICDGANRAFRRPTTREIFECNGVFEVSPSDNEVVAMVAPRLCAAFHRATLLLDGGNVQPGLPVQNYYGIGPKNWYAQLVHELAGVGYAFPFDDVNPTGTHDQSGILRSSNVSSITITIRDP